MTYDQLKAEEKKLLPFELLSKEQLLESGFIQDFIVTPQFVLIRFKCGKALYIVGNEMHVEDRINLVHVSKYENISAVTCTNMCSNFYNIGILSKEQYEHILKYGGEYLSQLEKNFKQEKIKNLKRQIEELEKEL